MNTTRVIDIWIELVVGNIINNSSNMSDSNSNDDDDNLNNEFSNINFDNSRST